MRFTVLIPARMSSSRLPNKPLADLAGIPMVVRVAQRSAMSQASRVVIAAEDDEIVSVAQQYGIEAIKTGSAHTSGTDRLAEAARLLRLPDDEIIVNVQGDEPFIEPGLVNETAKLLAVDLTFFMGTAAHPITDTADFLNPNVVKVVTALNDLRVSRAIYFSRAPIPFPRDAMNQNTIEDRDAQLEVLAKAKVLGFRHIGIYSYRNQALQQFASWLPSRLETSEALEQLRVIEKGLFIGLHLTPSLPAPGIDTFADLERARALLVN